MKPPTRKIAQIRRLNWGKISREGVPKAKTTGALSRHRRGAPVTGEARSISAGKALLRVDWERICRARVFHFNLSLLQKNPHRCVKLVETTTYYLIWWSVWSQKCLEMLKSPFTTSFFVLTFTFFLCGKYGYTFDLTLTNQISRCAERHIRTNCLVRNASIHI